MSQAKPPARHRGRVSGAVSVSACSLVLVVSCRRAEPSESPSQTVIQPVSLTPREYDQRGDRHLKAGRFEAAIADFDRFLASEPAAEPHHWRRGIAYYYAGRYREGVSQFELHRSVNPNDVENAVWHFLCKAKLDGAEAARAALLPVGRDHRIPMATVYEMFAGRATRIDVQREAEAAPPETRADALFYGHLYLGLYCDALGQAEPARHHIALAAEKHTSPHYMGDVARVHAALLDRR